MPNVETKLKIDPKIASLTAIIDTREQLPLDLKWRNGQQLAAIRGTLKTGDYSLTGFEEIISIERKSLGDLMGCISASRERFERELDRMLAFPVRAVVVEASWSDLEAGDYRARVHPNAAIGSVLSWISRGIPFILAGNRIRASEYVARLLVHGSKHQGTGTESSSSLESSPVKSTTSV